MVTRMEIDLEEHLNSHYLIKKDVNAGQMILILDGDCIEWAIINAQEEGVIFLVHKESWITQGDELDLM
jgi:hypothetical protein